LDRRAKQVIPLQVIELLIFAALAAVVLYQLYAVLGRRVGRQPEDNPQPAVRAPLTALPSAVPPVDGVALGGLAALKARDPSFELDHFLLGAKTAFETIVRAFAAGERDTLRPLVTPEVMNAFEPAIAAREAEGRTETVEFLQSPRADLEETDVQGDTALLKVRFLAEFRSRTKGPEGEGVDDRRTAEQWTFQRLLSGPDASWTLARVDAAQA
jgi:predicted lipid-binding transport protein (Tim44 family)